MVLTPFFSFNALLKNILVLNNVFIFFHYLFQYWVSQGNKWCDFCKIYIANNPLSIRTHELGQRHKDSVAKRLATMRKESAAKEKEQKEAARALEQIEAKVKWSYQKDLAAFKETMDSSTRPSGPVREAAETSKSITKDDFRLKQVSVVAEWEYDSASGCYYNPSSEHHYDPTSGLYYFATIVTKWSDEGTLSGPQGSTKPISVPPPGRVVSTPVNPLRSIKGVPSSIAVNKRKREGEKPKGSSKEEEAALKARETARKRVEEREAPLFGLHR
ncbi:zinc finger protein ZOP1-like [Aristolochia californica]|uniref:zinc finger protein ZOP1-like n=1 Tax=Aristolochia californica TaxID=171875 RepID=UPI0035DFC013